MKLSGIEMLAAAEQERPNDEKNTQAQILIALAKDAELFHTAEGDAFANIQTETHRETWPLKSKPFRMWLLRRFYEAQGKPPGTQALQDALGVLEAKAYYDGSKGAVFTRLAEAGGSIYIDLCNEAWQAVEISTAGWRVVTEHPVNFRRAKGMLPLTRPEAGGDINELRQFVNGGNDSDWCLLVSWLVAALRPRGPYPVLVLQGEQGCGKSTVAKVLRALVDPSIAPLRTTPREERDLAIAANNSWALMFDNLSGVPLWLSDALCRVATGGGYSTRTLYSDDEETIFNYVRPIVVNGIDEIVTRHDLLDRSLIISLPVIPEVRRQDEKKFWGSFEKKSPRIFGALLDAIAAGLRNANTVNLTRLPRMADFAKWVVAAEEALPWAPGAFLAAYSGNRTEAIELALDADIVAVAINALLARDASWEGSATELLAVLDGLVSEQIRKTRAWPKTARTLGNRLRRCATFLRQTGVEVEFGREGNERRRVIRISRNSIVRNGLNVREDEESPAVQGSAVRTLVRTQNAGNGLNVRTTSAQEPLQNKGLTVADVADAKKQAYSKSLRDEETEDLREVEF